jgi:NTE family protein
VSRAFVLAGGASLGAIQVGMLQALFERRITPDLVVGTSAGAINGGFVASRPPEVETARELARLWASTDWYEVFPPNPVTALLGAVGLRSHLVPDTGVRKLLRRHMRMRRLEEARVPLHVVTVEVLTGHERVLSRGPAEDAVMASAAIPAVFPPVRWDGVELVDGGVANNTPLSVAIGLGATEIFVLPTGPACPLERPPRSALDMALWAILTVIHNRLVREIAECPAGVRLVVLPPPCPLDVRPVDFSRSEELIEWSLRDSRRFLDQLPEAGAVPERMRAR